MGKTWAQRRQDNRRDKGAERGGDSLGRRRVKERKQNGLVEEKTIPVYVY